MPSLTERLSEALYILARMGAVMQCVVWRGLVRIYAKDDLIGCLRLYIFGCGRAVMGRAVIAWARRGGVR